MDKIGDDGFGVHFGVHDGSQRQWKRQKGKVLQVVRVSFESFKKSDHINWYSSNWQSALLNRILYYAKENSLLSKLGISFLFDMLNSATAAFKGSLKGSFVVAILLF